MSVVLGADGGLDPARPFDAGGVAGGVDGGLVEHGLGKA